MAMNTKPMKQVHASAQARAQETKRLYDEGFIDHDTATKQMASHQQQAKMESVHQRKDGVALAREAFEAQNRTKGSDRGPVRGQVKSFLCLVLYSTCVAVRTRVRAAAFFFLFFFLLLLFFFLFFFLFIFLSLFRYFIICSFFVLSFFFFCFRGSRGHIPRLS